jgi:hypothetical protein
LIQHLSLHLHLAPVTAQTLPVTTTLLFHLLTPWTWTTTSSYLGPNLGSQTHPRDVRTDVSSSRNPDIRTSLDPDFGYLVLLRIPSSDSNRISGNLGIYDNCSRIPSLPCSYPPSPSPQFMSPCLQAAYCIPTAHVSHSLGSRTHLLMVSPFTIPPFLHLAP